MSVLSFLMPVPVLFMPTPFAENQILEHDVFPAVHSFDNYRYILDHFDKYAAISHSIVITVCPRC